MVWLGVSASTASLHVLCAYLCTFVLVLLFVFVEAYVLARASTDLYACGCGLVWVLGAQTGVHSSTLHTMTTTVLFDATRDFGQSAQDINLIVWQIIAQPVSAALHVYCMFLVLAGHLTPGS